MPVIERVARAIYDTQENGISWDDPTLGDWRKDYEREKACAALRALVDEARDGDEFVSGHDLCVRIGATVLEASRDAS